jgi:hypothetical protein
VRVGVGQMPFEVNNIKKVRLPVVKRKRFLLVSKLGSTLADDETGSSTCGCGQSQRGGEFRKRERQMSKTTGEREQMWICVQTAHGLHLFDSEYDDVEFIPFRYFYIFPLQYCNVLGLCT